MISSTSDLAGACERLARHPFITVDTEFLRETTFWPKLCVVQLASLDEAVVVDALAEGLDLAPFFELMANEQVLKVFHAARQDIEIVWHLAGIVPHPVFDTQVAAMVLGHGDSISYDQLVQRLTGHVLDKSLRFTDWSRRPLSTAQITYAEADVTHLRDVFVKLDADLAKRGRSEWVSEEMAVLTSPDTYRQEPDARMGAAALARPQAEGARRADREVAAWREREAQGRDMPRSRILKDEVIGEIATQQPTTPERLGTAAFHAQGVRALARRRADSGSGEGRARARSQDACRASSASGRSPTAPRRRWNS